MHPSRVAAGDPAIAALRNVSDEAARCDVKIAVPHGRYVGFATNAAVGVFVNVVVVGIESIVTGRFAVGPVRTASAREDANRRKG